MVLRTATLLTCLAATAIAGGPAQARGVIVKFRSDGEHALRECAEHLFREGRSFQYATADRSPSLDRIKREAGVRAVRSLFRRPDGNSFQRQRRSLSDRLSRKARGNSRLPDLAHIYRVEIAPEVSVSEALSLFAADPHVEYVQRDHQHDLDQQVPLPDDPLLHSRGSWGQDFEDLWGLYRIRAPAAWTISQGEGVVVAVVDTGLDYDHEDIRDNVWVNPGEDLNGNGVVDDSDWNGLDDDGNGFVDDLRGFDFANSLDADQDGRFDGPTDISDPDPFDDWGHGTHVAGTIAAVANNGVGIAGVAPRARIMALKGFPASGSGLDSDLWRAVLYAAENGASVINTSWSCRPDCPENPLAEEIVRIVHALDVVIVTSAGNRTTDVVFNSPENMRETITVASSGQDDLPSASFTNFGWLVDVAAPGGGPSDDRSVRIARRNILSLRSSGDRDESTAYATVEPGYWRLSGTSMAAPHVAGVVALLRSAYPELDYESVRRLLRQGAEDTGPPGHDASMGAGRVDAFGSLAHPPLPELDAVISSPRQGSVYTPRNGAEVEIRGTAAGDDLESWELSYGLGNVPVEWHPIELAAAGAVRDGLLARWPVTGLAEGTYVVRLRVRGREGSLYSEFLLVSLEQVRGHRISSLGRPASKPSISQGVVAWESRREAQDSHASSQDFNLFASDFDGERHFVVSEAPGDQEVPSISGRVVSWLDSRAGLDDPEIFGCLLGRRTGTCQNFPVSLGRTTRLAPISAASHVFWVDGRTGEPDIRACRPDAASGSCEPAEPGLEPARRSFLRSDGQSLAWAEPGRMIGVCRVDPETGKCPAVAPDRTFVSTSRPAVSGSLIAWVEASFTGMGGLKVCELEPETQACRTIDVMNDVDDPVPVLSGNRLVWDARIGDEGRDVFFCEFDRIRSRCPVQRLTAQMAKQTAAVIDDRLVAWEDQRNGGSEIHGLRLPALRRMRNRRVRVGSIVAVPVRPAVAGEHLSLAVEAVGATSLVDVGARFSPNRGGSGLFLWRPDRSQRGTHAFTFSGTTEAGLTTRQTIEIEVVEGRRKRGRGPWKSPHGRARSGRFR